MPQGQTAWIRIRLRETRFLVDPCCLQIHVSPVINKEICRSGSNLFKNITSHEWVIRSVSVSNCLDPDQTPSNAACSVLYNVLCRFCYICLWYEYYQLMLVLICILNNKVMDNKKERLPAGVAWMPLIWMLLLNFEPWIFTNPLFGVCNSVGQVQPLCNSTSSLNQSYYIAN